MGREYILVSEFEPARCPYCGSRRLKIYGAKKMEYEAVYDVISKTVEDCEYVNTEYDVIYGVECAECGEDLSEKYGL